MRKSRYIILKPIIAFFILLFSSTSFSQEFLDLELEFVDGNNFFCGSSSLTNIDFSIKFNTATFPVDNNFIVQLSDANGDFENITDEATIIGSPFNGNFLVESSYTMPTNLVGGDYRIQIKSTNPERTSDPSMFFQAYSVPDINLILNNAQDATICEGTSIDISLNTLGNSSFENTYVWYKGIAPQEVIVGENGPTLTVTEAGVYRAAFDLGGNCTGEVSGSESNFITVTSIEADDFFIEGGNTIAICSNETYDLVANIDNEDYIYIWFKDGVELKSEEGLSTFTTEDVDQFGTYSLKVDTGGCVIDSENTIVIEPLEVAGFEVTIDSALARVLLPNETIEFNVDIDPMPSLVGYQWFKNGEPLSGNTNSSVNIIDAGEYFVRVTDFSSTCSPFKDSEIYTVFDITDLIVEIRTDQAYVECNSRTVILSDVGVKGIATTGEIVDLTSEQLDLLSYQWLRNDQTIIGEVSQDLEITSYIDNDNYSLFVSIGLGENEVNGITEIPISVLLTPGSEIVSSSVSNTLCPGDVINLSIENLSGFTYTWLKNGVEFIVDDSSTVDVNEIGEYSVTYDGFGCRVETEIINVIEFDDDALQVSPSTRAILLPGETVILTASGADSYEWFNEAGDLLSSNETLEIGVTGSYTVIGAVGDCKGNKTIEVEPDDGSFTIPNIISPFNGDGVNDTWEIPNKFSFQESVQVIIYNSRGNELLNTTDYQNNWPEDNNIKAGMLFYFRVIKENNLIKAGTISVLK